MEQRFQTALTKWIEHQLGKKGILNTMSAPDDGCVSTSMMDSMPREFSLNRFVANY